LSTTGKWVLAAAVALCGACTSARAAPPVAMRPVAVRDVRVADTFWAARLKVMRENTIPHSWDWVKGAVQELKLAGKLTTEKPPPEHRGRVKWREANLHKLLETCAYALAQRKDPKLDAKVDAMIAIIGAAQQPDGFAHAWAINRTPRRWRALGSEHNGYVQGHLYEAAVAHYRATGKQNYLDIAVKSADQAWRHFIQDKNPGVPGHAEIKLALVELYRETKNEKYLELARAFIERRGKPPGSAYRQEHLPIRQQNSIEGHAVRAVFFATGVADVALATGDKDLRAAANRLWTSAAGRKLYITGSAGALGAGEAFGPDYVLPNTGYAESCAGCGMANFAHRMLQLEADAAMADELERVLYNAVLHGIALDGRSSYYRNPLSDKDRLRDNNWCCCPPVLSRTIMLVGRYAYGRTDRDIYVNLYVGGEATFALKHNRVALKVETEYPWKPTVAMTVNPSAPAEFAVRLRMPYWSRDTKLALNGKALSKPTLEKGYAVIRRRWKPGDTIGLAFDMPVMRMEAHPKVEADRGRVAIQRGPIVYGLEGLDNDGTPLVTLPKDPAFKVKHETGLLGGVTVITGKAADGKAFTAIPFYALANRGKSNQEVWLPQEGKTKDPRGWEGRLYREWRP
jgi:DUF1680 family protein